MNHLTQGEDSELPQTEEFEMLDFLETLVDKVIKRLDDQSYKPRVQDALKAIQLIQKVSKTSKSERIFWHLIDRIRRDEYSRRHPKTPNLETQIQNTIRGLKHLVKNGMLPVKTITDSFNEGKSEESRLTYHKVGRLLSSLGFRKTKTRTGTYAILWYDQLLDNDASAGSGNLSNSLPPPSGAGKESGTECPHPPTGLSPQGSQDY
jgi:hypothetical protein